MTGLPIYFNPYASGLEVFLGPTEARVMELCWQRGPLTVKKALFHFEGKPKPAYTTIMTVMARLAEKGLLNRKKDGRFFIYTAAVSRDDFVASRIDLISDCLEKYFPRRPGKKRK